jgi:predicted nucleic acid-binding protein
MKAWFADTFFFIALIVEDDEAHELADRFAAESARLITTTWVLTELADAMAEPARRHRFPTIPARSSQCAERYDSLA